MIKCYSFFAKWRKKDVDFLNQLKLNKIIREGYDGFWSSFQQKTNEFVNKNKGESIINAPVKHRPDCEDVRDVLKGVKPISELGCK